MAISMCNCFVAIIVVLVAMVATVINIDSDHFRFLPKDNSVSIIGLFNEHGHPKDELSEIVSQYSQGQDKVADSSMKTQEETSFMVENYYKLATDFYEYGWGTSFHFAHTWANETHKDSMIRHEQRIVDYLGAKEGDKVLDVGCGVGGPAREVARFSNAHVTGVTISGYQVNRANHHTKTEGLEGRVLFKRMDFTKLEFPEDTFDHAYAVEATVHANKLEDVFSEVFRVLKPGGQFFDYEWLTTEAYDQNNEKHNAILREIEYGNGLPKLRDIAAVKAAAEKVGFVVKMDHDLAQDLEGVRPWWNEMQVAKDWARLTHIVCYVTEFLGMAPKGTVSAHSVLLHAAAGLVDGGDENVFTPMHMVLMQKPL